MSAAPRGSSSSLQRRSADGSNPSLAPTLAAFSSKVKTRSQRSALSRSRSSSRTSATRAPLASTALRFYPSNLTLLFFDFCGRSLSAASDSVNFFLDLLGAQTAAHLPHTRRPIRVTAATAAGKRENGSRNNDGPAHGFIQSAVVRCCARDRSERIGNLIGTSHGIGSTHGRGNRVQEARDWILRRGGTRD